MASCDKPIVGIPDLTKRLTQGTGSDNQNKMLTGTVIRWNLTAREGRETFSLELNIVTQRAWGKSYLSTTLFCFQSEQRLALYPVLQSVHPY